MQAPQRRFSPTRSIRRRVCQIARSNIERRRINALRSLFFTHYERKHYEIESHVTLLRVLREQRHGGYHCANVHGRYKGCWRTKHRANTSRRTVPRPAVNPARPEHLRPRLNRRSSRNWPLIHRSTFSPTPTAPTLGRRLLTPPPRTQRTASPRPSTARRQCSDEPARPVPLVCPAGPNAIRPCLRTSK